MLVSTAKPVKKAAVAHAPAGTPRRRPSPPRISSGSSASPAAAPAASAPTVGAEFSGRPRPHRDGDDGRDEPGGALHHEAEAQCTLLTLQHPAKTVVSSSGTATVAVMTTGQTLSRLSQVLMNGDRAIASTVATSPSAGRLPPPRRQHRCHRVVSRVLGDLARTTTCRLTTGWSR